MAVDLRHGGNREAIAEQLGCRPSQLLDASASLVPWTPRLGRVCSSAIRDYPDRRHRRLREVIAARHSLDPDQVLPGNGAAELFTWAARDAASAGISVVPAPGFADYTRALNCWQAPWREQPLPLVWDDRFPQSVPDPGGGDVLWLCNPHNPTGQLWSRRSLQPLFSRFALVICDEGFLPLVPDGAKQSLIPLLDQHPNLVVIRSLTKLFGIAGLRLGYALAAPGRLRRWAAWRDPWPLNGPAEAVGLYLLRDAERYGRWCARAQRWTAREGAWLQAELARLPGLTSLPSAANFSLLHGAQSLVPVRETLERQHHVLLRDCGTFSNLGERWLRIGLQTRRRNRRIVSALRQATSCCNSADKR